MGQKVHPGGLRVGVIHDWKSNWWTGKKEIADYVLEDIRIRDHINGKLAHAGLSDILIRKDKQRITVDIYTARPGIVIGKSGSEVDALRKELHGMTGKSVQVAPQGVDLGAGLADHDARPRGVDVDLHLGGVLADRDVRQAGVGELARDVVADADVLDQEVGEVLLGEPVRLPVVDVPDAHRLGMNLLSH